MPEEKTKPEDKIKKSIRYTKDGVELRSVAVAFLKDLNAITILYYGTKYYFRRPSVVVVSFFIVDMFGPNYSRQFLNYIIVELGFHESGKDHLIHLFLLFMLVWLCSLTLILLYKIGSRLIRYRKDVASSRSGEPQA